MTFFLLFLLSCAPSTWRECYSPDDAFNGIDNDATPLIVEWCDNGHCFEVGYTRTETELVVYEVGMQGADDPSVCVVWWSE